MKDTADGFLTGVVIVWLWTLVSVEPPVRPYTVEYAEKVCASNGGWVKIEEGYGFFSSIECKNGAEFGYDWSKLKSDDSTNEGEIK